MSKSEKDGYLNDWDAIEKMAVRCIHWLAEGEKFLLTQPDKALAASTSKMLLDPCIDKLRQFFESCERLRIFSGTIVKETRHGQN